MIARRRRGESGAAMVEFLLIAPLLMLMLVGVIEFGLVHRDRLIAATASRGGARVLASGGDSRLADFDTIKSVEAALTELNTAEVVKVVIFKPDANGEMPSICEAGSVTDRCNHYLPADLGMAVNAIKGNNDCVGSSPDRFWCPLDRVIDQDVGLSWVGLRVELQHTSIAPMIPDRTIVADTIMRVEPRAEDS